MKKSIIILALAALALMVFPLAAGATYFDVNTHGGWGTSTAGCADCHTTHAANAAFLLANGPTETDACYACHGSGENASPYDVANGAIYINYDYTRTPRAMVSTGTVLPSYAGGFKNSYMFAAATDVGQDAVVEDATHFVTSSSAHNVEQPVANDMPGTAWESNTVKIPGGVNIVTGNIFKCGSCHDPHAGTNANTTARLLRINLPAATVTIDFETAGTVNLTTYRVTAYPEAINTWCAGCHDYFDAADQSGHVKSAQNKYRHPMGITLNSAPTDATISYGTPLSKTTNQLICFSCHRAHGTAVSMTGAATTFNRYNGDAGSTATSTALLRLKNRDTCYNCHGAAETNTYSIMHP